MTGRGEIPGLFPLLERYKTRKERYTALQSTRFVLLWSRIEGFYKPLGHAPAAFCVADDPSSSLREWAVRHFGVFGEPFPQ